MLPKSDCDASKVWKECFHWAETWLLMDGTDASNGLIQTALPSVGMMSKHHAWKRRYRVSGVLLILLHPIRPCGSCQRAERSGFFI
jgi:hypothetical protein